jgi:hypothetical protein
MWPGSNGAPIVATAATSGIEGAAARTAAPPEAVAEGRDALSGGRLIFGIG